MSKVDSNFNHVDVVIPTILFETFFFGAYSALLVFSTILLCRRSPSRTRHALLAISMVMYTVSAAHWALVIATLSEYDGSFSFRLGSDITVIYLPAINYILSDGIVLWRAWVLWDRRLLLFIPPLISLVCTIATTVTSAVYSSYYEVEVEAFFRAGSGFNVQPLIKDQNLSMYLEWSTWFLTFGTNLWATGLIFIRAWQHRRFLRLLSVKETLTRNTEKALAFLVESGALYLLIWLVYISTSIPLDPYGRSFFHSAMSQVVGMYPTVIVIVVTMRLSTADVLSRPGDEPNSPMVFNIMPPNPLPQTAGARDIEGSWDGTTAMKT